MALSSNGLGHLTFHQVMRVRISLGSPKTKDIILIIICNECNEEFNKRPSRINKENFCSPKCFNINKSKKTDVYTQCTECKKDIIKKYC